MEDLLGQSSLTHSVIQNESILSHSDLVVANSSNVNHRMAFLFCPWRHDTSKIDVLELVIFDRLLHSFFILNNFAFQFISFK